MGFTTFNPSYALIQRLAPQHCFNNLPRARKLRPRHPHKRSMSPSCSAAHISSKKSERSSGKWWERYVRLRPLRVLAAARRIFGSSTRRSNRKVSVDIRNYGVDNINHLNLYLHPYFIGDGQMRKVMHLTLTFAFFGCISSSAIAQQCQACRCDGSNDTYPASSLADCVYGCGAWEVVCGGNITQHGFRHSGVPKAPKDCSIQFVPNGGTLVGPASGCPSSSHGPPTRDPCHPGGMTRPNAC
jgi:hypothetical protein